MVVYTLNKSRVVILSPIEYCVFFLDRFYCWSMKENEENESQERIIYNYIEE